MIALSTSQSAILVGQLEAGSTPLLDVNNSPVKVDIVGEPTKRVIQQKDKEDFTLFIYSIKPIVLPLGPLDNGTPTDLVVDKVSSLEKNLSGSATLSYRMGSRGKYQFTL